MEKLKIYINKGDISKGDKTCWNNPVCLAIKRLYPQYNYIYIGWSKIGFYKNNLLVECEYLETKILRWLERFYDGKPCDRFQFTLKFTRAESPNADSN
jgi:hypothetical protein